MNSYFIRKNNDYITNNDYIIYPNGKQVYKKIKNCEILINDYTGNRLSIDMLIIIELWIKDSFTDIIFFDKVYKRTLFCPRMEKIDKLINKVVDEYEKDRSSSNPIEQ